MIQSFKELIHLFGITVETGKQQIYTFVYQKKSSRSYKIVIILLYYGYNITHREMVKDIQAKILATF